jgi:acyl-CoA thioesterase-2
MPDVPRADDLAGPSWTGLFERRFVAPPSTDPGRALAWLRLHDAVPDDPLLHACGLAYVSDDCPTDAVFGLHPDRPAHSELDLDNPHQVLLSASLDHAIWFHHSADISADPSQWQLHDLRSDGLAGSRGLATGTVYTAEGVRIATISQEVLVRKRR